jgi:hypothetical protein
VPATLTCFEPLIVRNIPQYRGSMTSQSIWISRSAVAIVLFSLTFGVPAGAQTITTAMSGLDAPRGLAWGPEGGLYVTEAGTGVSTGPCTPVAQGSDCYSETGKVTRLFHGEQERVATGLPSLFNTARGDVVVSGPRRRLHHDRMGRRARPSGEPRLGRFVGTGQVLRIVP